MLVLNDLQATRVAKPLRPHPLTPNSQFPPSCRAFRRRNRPIFATHKRTSMIFHARVTSRRGGPPRSSGSPSPCAQLRPAPHPLTPKSQLPLLSRPARGLRPRLGVGIWDLGGGGRESEQEWRTGSARIGICESGNSGAAPRLPAPPATRHPPDSQIPTPASSGIVGGQPLQRLSTMGSLGSMRNLAWRRRMLSWGGWPPMAPLTTRVPDLYTAFFPHRV